jgi:Leucine-rich repeat (LRR) protein
MVVRNLFLVLLVSIQWSVVNGQSNWGAKYDTNRVWTNLDTALAYPAEVVSLDLSKHKLNTFPKSILKLENLEVLNLGRNKLTSIPAELNQLKNLRILVLEKNKIISFPIAVCSMDNLEQLIMNRNQIITIPNCIQYAKNLQYLDVWSNQIENVPDEISKLENLKEFDLRGLTYAPEFNKRIKGLLPHAVVKMEPPCDCMAGEK